MRARGSVRRLEAHLRSEIIDLRGELAEQGADLAGARGEIELFEGRMAAMQADVDATRSERDVYQAKCEAMEAYFEEHTVRAAVEECVA